MDGALAWTDGAVAVRTNHRPAPETVDRAGSCSVQAITELTDAERELGLALYRLRAEGGLSLRALAKLMGYSAHSVFADVEKARRFPSESLIRCYEEHFDVPPDSLMALRRRALRERAVRLTARFAAASSAGPSPTPSPSPSPSASPSPSPALAVAPVVAPARPLPTGGTRFGDAVHGLLPYLRRTGRCLARTLRAGRSWPRRPR